MKYGPFTFALGLYTSDLGLKCDGECPAAGARNLLLPLRAVQGSTPPGGGVSEPPGAAPRSALTAVGEPGRSQMCFPEHLFISLLAVSRVKYVQKYTSERL